MSDLQGSCESWGTPRPGVNRCAFGDLGALSAKCWMNPVNLSCGVPHQPLTSQLWGGPTHQYQCWMTAKLLAATRWHSKH